MTLKLYGYPASSFTRLVAMILTEKKVPFEFVKVGMDVGEHKSPAFLEKQPFGQVPVIVRAAAVIHPLDWFVNTDLPIAGR
jgi:glutathione S-transferase